MHLDILSRPRVYHTAMDRTASGATSGNWGGLENATTPRSGLILGLDGVIGRDVLC